MIPLGKAPSLGDAAMKGLTPEVSFQSEKLLLLTPQISSIPRKRLKEPVGSMLGLRDEVLAALDFAIAGI